jgi:hypothetical protein
MYLMAFPYFISYHNLAAVLLRRIAGCSSSEQQPAWTIVNVVGVIGMAYTTAVLEAWSISAFPGYTYPDEHVRLSFFFRQTLHVRGCH